MAFVTNSEVRSCAVSTTSVVAPGRAARTIRRVYAGFSVRRAYRVLTVVSSTDASATYPEVYRAIISVDPQKRRATVYPRPWRTNALAGDHPESAPVGPGSPPFSATVVALDGNAVVALVGDLDLNTVPDLTHVLDRLIESDPAEVVLDFSGLSFIDSTGISVLIASDGSLNQRGRPLTIRSRDHLH
jgi:anti-anti-sigma factor